MAVTPEARERVKPAEWIQDFAGSLGVSDRLSERLEQLIFSGRIPVGERLPTERALATMLQVSRSSVREALRELQLKGLVDRRQGRGTTVVEHDRSPITELIGLLKPEQRQLREILDFRMAIEPPIAARAAERVTHTELSRLTKTLARFDDASTASAHAELDVAFHLLVARATHNPLLVRVTEVSAEWMASSRASTLMTTKRRLASKAGHNRILTALRAADPAAAEKAMMDHVRGVAEIVLDDDRFERGYGDP